LLLAHRHPPLPADLPLPAGRPRRAGTGHRGHRGLKKGAAAGELVLLSQDEARCPMVPTLQATLGVKGHRPVVGTHDSKDVLYVFAVMNLISGVIHATTSESLHAANRKSQESKTRRMQRAFAAHLRHVGRMYPRERCPRVVLLIDNAPWHRGKLIDEALA